MIVLIVALVELNDPGVTHDRLWTINPRHCSRLSHGDFTLAVQIRLGANIAADNRVGPSLWCGVASVACWTGLIAACPSPSRREGADPARLLARPRGTAVSAGSVRLLVQSLRSPRPRTHCRGTTQRVVGVWQSLLRHGEMSLRSRP